MRVALIVPGNIGGFICLFNTECILLLFNHTDLKMTKYHRLTVRFMDIMF